MRFYGTIYSVQISNVKKGGDIIKNFCFTVDDNIRVLKEITEACYQSIFDHPYLLMYRRLHERFGLKVQLNLFYRAGDFDLSQMTDRYYEEWKENSDWLKLSFHSDIENIKPYEAATYDEVYVDCKRTNDQIKRFASSEALANTTTIHYCLLTASGLKAIEENGISGLLGLFGTNEQPRTSYEIGEEDAKRIRNGEVVKIGKISFASIDIVLNLFSINQILEQLEQLTDRSSIKVMIHEQYFYRDYIRYQPEFEKKLEATFAFLIDHGYQSKFYENVIP